MGNCLQNKRARHRIRCIKNKFALNGKKWIRRFSMENNRKYGRFVVKSLCKQIEQ